MKEIKEKVCELIKGLNPTQQQIDYVAKEFEAAIPFEGGMSTEEAMIVIYTNIMREEKKKKK